MTIDEAIRRMKARVAGEFYDSDPENLEDMRLGIEAMKHLRRGRENGEIYRLPLLPGETKE